MGDFFMTASWSNAQLKQAIDSIRRSDGLATTSLQWLLDVLEESQTPRSNAVRQAALHAGLLQALLEALHREASPKLGNRARLLALASWEPWLAAARRPPLLCRAMGKRCNS